MIEQMLKTANAIARFYCGRKGAAAARMMICFCAAVLFVSLGVGAYLAPPTIRAILQWSEDIKTSLAAVHREVADMKAADALREASNRERVENRDRRIDQAENEIDALTRIANDHERRIYRIEGLR